MAVWHLRCHSSVGGQRCGVWDLWTVVPCSLPECSHLHLRPPEWGRLRHPLVLRHLRKPKQPDCLQPTRRGLVNVNSSWSNCRLMYYTNRILNINFRSIVGKGAEIAYLLDSMKPDISPRHWDMAGPIYYRFRVPARPIQVLQGVQERLEPGRRGSTDCCQNHLF